MKRPRFALVSVRSAVAAAVLVAAPGGAGGLPEPAFLFTELSTLSGGPVDFEAPVSQGEKATGAFVDVDGDGWDDIVALGGAGEPCQLLLNVDDGEGGRTFVPAPPGHGLATGQPFLMDASVVSAADVDNDGDQDLFLGGGYNTVLPTGKNALLLNDGTGTFTDVAEAAGVAGGDSDTSCAVLFDADMDGDLDLFTADCNAPGIGHFGDGKPRLYRNLLKEGGTLVFEDISDTNLVGAANSKGAWAALALDTDSDGDQDLVFTHDLLGPTQLLANNGSGLFSDVSSLSGRSINGSDGTFGNDTPNGMSVDAVDVDHDGVLDFYIADINDNALYHGLPGFPGQYEQVGSPRGVSAGGVTWGSVFSDFDLDGHPDLYVAGGDFDDAQRITMRPWLYRNNGTGNFAEVDRTEAGLRHDTPKHREMGSAVADYDGDGDPDLLVVRAEDSGASPYLYRNDTAAAANRWIALRLRGDGVLSNRDAIGARIRVTPKDAFGDPILLLRQLREVHSSQGRGSRNSLSAPFGLGPDAVSADVEVLWPRVGPLASRRIVYRSLPIDTVVTITDDPEIVPPPTLVPAVESAVPCGRATSIPLASTGDDPPETAVLESGPEWASLAQDGDGAWRLDVDPPASSSHATFPITILSGPSGEPGAYTTVTVAVLTTPWVDEVSVRRKGRLLVVTGRNFRKSLADVSLGDTPAKRIVYVKKPLEADGDFTVLRVFLPKLPPEIREAAQDLVVSDAVTQRASVPLPVTLSGP
jgi:hypothetical protein